MTRPKRIEVIRRGFRYRVLVDGEPLPYSLSRDMPPIVAVDPDDVPTVTLTLMADQVDVINQRFDEGGDGDGETCTNDGEDHRNRPAEGAAGRAPRGHQGGPEEGREGVV